MLTALSRKMGFYKKCFKQFSFFYKEKNTVFSPWIAIFFQEKSIDVVSCTIERMPRKKKHYYYKKDIKTCGLLILQGLNFSPHILEISVYYVTVIL